jgi:hypothetical protein
MLKRLSDRAKGSLVTLRQTAAIATAATAQKVEIKAA